jgi:hypothetical protein
MFKFEMGDTVYYLANNKVHSANILARCWVEGVDNLSMSHVNTADGHFELYPFNTKAGGTATQVYSTCHGNFTGEILFKTRQALCNSIMGIEPEESELAEYKEARRHFFLDNQGRMQGEYKDWYENGSLFEHALYVDGKCHGECKMWGEDGTLIAHKFWVDDNPFRDLIKEPVDAKEKDRLECDTGGKWLPCNSIMGIEGNCDVVMAEVETDTVHYFEDAKGQKQGEYKRWWTNGNINEHCFNVDHELHGEAKYWNEDGKLEHHDFWVHGKVYRDLLVNPVDANEKDRLECETGGKWLP